MIKERRITRDDLPEDLVVEILSRIPVVSLVRLRATSKAWNVLIKDGRVAKKQYDNNEPRRPRHSLIIMLIAFRVYLVNVDLHQVYNNKVKIISQFSLKDPTYNSLKEVDICNIFHCDGLLLCTTKYSRLVVWNPCSGETKLIKPSRFYESDIYALGKSSCNKYKVLRINQDYFTSRSVLVECEIYDFTSNSWRVVGKTSRWFIRDSKGCGTSVNGNTYWLANSSKDTNRDFLLGFDFSTERFTSVSLPGDHRLYDRLIALSVTREDQKLCMLAIQARWPTIGDVWIATKIESSTGTASWAKFLSLDLIGKPVSFISVINFLLDKKDKVLVCRGKHRASTYFLYVVGEDNKCIQVDHHDPKSTCLLVVNYVPTLVQINQSL
ncbi:hypothetical protein CARUB_v10002866mg [Capsella rubella]|uniref:F-box domain-containing protein n=1 Tax=Capsella rubella TaxID=81985 RepID=R0HB73_9BRAS|nr:putative F-box protein At4g10190 [Capsella rubella]EOA22270.1 hypothetical protein CARUB_v10002866mg [Capsella rubella]